MQKKYVLWMIAMVFGFGFTGQGFAGDTVVGTVDSSETTVVDLSDVDTDQPVQSPSFENTTPAGQAPGQPIES